MLKLSRIITTAHLNSFKTLLMMSKVRKSMEESPVEYQIGGEDCIIECDEADIGGVGQEKQKILVLLEKNKTGKKGRLRVFPIANKSADTVEKVLLPCIKKGSELHTDGNPIYTKLKTRYPEYFNLKAVAHWQEDYSHEFLKDLNCVIGNLKTWYRGVHHSFRLKNTGYYLNEFCYRFNRRRSEVNIFEKLLARSVVRPKILKYKEFSNSQDYSPLAA